MTETSSVGPIGERERVRELDVLRGVALFGVLVANFVGFAGEHVLTTPAQLAALPTAAIDRPLYLLVEWLIGDKANTMFATLFGLGFYLQMQRSAGKPGFEARYARRLLVLLAFGWLNMLFLWVWDILNLYALAGFFLLAMRRWRTRTLLVFGVAAALYSDKLQMALGAWIATPWGETDQIYTDAAVLARQELVRGGDYGAIVAGIWQWTWIEWFAGGMMFAWIFYALGRFALGACIGRSGILDDIPRHLPLLRRVTWIALPSGLLLALVARLLGEELWRPFAGSDELGEILRSPAALVLAAGYAAGIVVALHRPAGARLFGMFAPVGRMALTNYLVQGFLYAFVLFGVGPGLALAGRIGTAPVLLICIAFFAAQIAFSHWWLARYRFGPMEWLWRALTYGERPQMRRTSAPSASPA